MIDVVALGELLIDFACTGSGADGYPTMAAHPGGAPANLLAAVAKFGGRAAMLGKVGKDAFGAMLKETLRKAGIETGGLLEDETCFTTLAFVTFDETGNREFSFARKPGADTQLRFEDLNLQLIDNARVFHFGSLSLTDEPARTATRKALAYAREKGKLITYDPNLRMPLWKDPETAREQLIWGLQQADVVKISDEEVEFLFGLGVREGARYLLDTFGIQLVFVTCGPDGCWFESRKARGHVDSLKDIQVRDTCGAGDIFGGSALFKLLETHTPPQDLSEAQLREIVTFACTAAGLSTTRSGGIPSIPSLSEVLARMPER